MENNFRKKTLEKKHRMPQLEHIEAIEKRGVAPKQRTTALTLRKSCARSM